MLDLEQLVSKTLDLLGASLQIRLKKAGALRQPWRLILERGPVDTSTPPPPPGKGRMCCAQAGLNLEAKE